MAALDFPNSPTIGQTYPSPPVAGMPTYTWNGTSWDSSVGPYLPSGTVTDFFQAAAPTGWTRVTTYDDALIRIVGSAAPASGGSNGFVGVFNAQTATAAFTEAVANMPSHNHPGSATGRYCCPDVSSSYIATSGGWGFSTTVTINAQGGGTAHSHGITTGIKYVDVLLASKN